MTDKGVIIRLYDEQDVGFKKRVAMIKLNNHETAGIEFHHERYDLLQSLSVGSFVQVDFEIKGKASENRIYNNLVGVGIEKIC